MNEILTKEIINNNKCYMMIWDYIETAGGSREYLDVWSIIFAIALKLYTGS